MSHMFSLYLQYLGVDPTVLQPGTQGMYSLSTSLVGLSGSQERPTLPTPFKFIPCSPAWILLPALLFFPTAMITF